MEKNLLGDHSDVPVGEEVEQNGNELLVEEKKGEQVVVEEGKGEQLVEEEDKQEKLAEVEEKGAEIVVDEAKEETFVVEEETKGDELIAEEQKGDQFEEEKLLVLEVKVEKFVIKEGIAETFDVEEEEEKEVVELGEKEKFIVNEKEEDTLVVADENGAKLIVDEDNEKKLNVAPEFGDELLKFEILTDRKGYETPMKTYFKQERKENVPFSFVAPKSSRKSLLEYFDPLYNTPAYKEDEFEDVQLWEDAESEDVYELKESTKLIAAKERSPTDLTDFMGDEIPVVVAVMEDENDAIDINENNKKMMEGSSENLDKSSTNENLDEDVRKELNTSQQAVASLEETMKTVNTKLATELSARKKDEIEHRKTMEEYERKLSLQISEMSKLAKEHKTVKQHFANLELAFSDVHQKYERCKKIIDGYKSNEITLRQNLMAAEETVVKSEEKYELLKSHAKAQIEKSNLEIITTRDQYESEIHKFTAIIRRLEIKNASLVDSLEQKTKECAALAALCDEVTGKV